MSETTTDGRTWVAFGPAGALGSIHETGDGFSVRLLDDATPATGYPTLEAAKGALMARLPSGSERPEFREH